MSAGFRITSFDRDDKRRECVYRLKPSERARPTVQKTTSTSVARPLAGGGFMFVQPTLTDAQRRGPRPDQTRQQARSPGPCERVNNREWSGGPREERIAEDLQHVRHRFSDDRSNG
jgi:hypothetical protein